MPQDRPTLEYATPQRVAKKSQSPYIAFAICAGLTTLCFLTWENGGRTDKVLAGLAGIPSALGAIVLPLLLQLRQQ
jgi:hypothetical protein